MDIRATRARSARAVAFLAVTALFTGLAACGAGEKPDEGGVVEPPPGDSVDSGSMQAFMNDDPSSSSATAAGRAQASYSGTMTGEADVEVSTDRSTWYTMGSPRDFELTLQSGDASAELTAGTDVPAGTYRYVRINWNGVEANLDAGSQVQGQTLSSGVSLRLGDATTAVMSQEVDAFELQAGASARIVVDLNSETWITTENVSTRQIPKEEFENKAEISIVAGS